MRTRQWTGREMMRAVVTVATAVVLARSSNGQVGAAALKHCESLGFSTSEDFVTRGPEPPDGNPIVSDGDLLGVEYGGASPQCYICARNSELLKTFDVSVDLGLDSVDVLDVDAYVVALSTELDSPTEGQFKAGDLLVTDGNVIPNRALTYAFGPGAITYDLGLDAVHFVGAPQQIALFLADARQLSRTDWLANPATLQQLLVNYEVDIWFSTEGTWGTPGSGGFLDGDLLSAASGTIVAENKDLLPASVPAGIPVRGVDFGLDGVTSGRDGDPAGIHFSTEILFSGTPSFSDGDVIKAGHGVVTTNTGLTFGFEPLADELGLDALSIAGPAAEGCVSRLTRIGGADVADISLTNGRVLPGVLGINAAVPFGGRIDFQGTLCDDVDRFRLLYRLAGSGNPWQPIEVAPSKHWTVAVDAFFPPTPDCLGTQTWSSDAGGWFDGADYRHLTKPGLGGCNPDLPLAVWESSLAVNGNDKLYEVVLETDVGGTVHTNDMRLVQIDNTKPTVEIEKQAGECNTLAASDMPYTVKARMQDAHFYRYRLSVSGGGYPAHVHLPVAFYDDPTDNVIEVGTVDWNTFVDLQEITVTNLTPNPVACGYTVILTGWDRTIWCGFSYSNNWASRCVGCGHATDTWTFNYTPTP